MASRLLDRLKRSLFKDGQRVGHEQDAGDGREQEAFHQDRWEAELEEEEECVTEQLRGMLCFDGRVGGEDGAEGEESGLDSDSDFLGESMEEGISSTDTSPVGVCPVGPSSSSPVTRQFQQGWRNLRGPGGGPVSSGRRLMDDLLFEVTDASVIHDGSSKYVLYTVHVIQSGGSDKTPAVITRRYSDFQRLHATLRRNHGDQMERVYFPRVGNPGPRGSESLLVFQLSLLIAFIGFVSLCLKPRCADAQTQKPVVAAGKKLRRNFTAETIAKRSQAFEQYLTHLCSLTSLRALPCVREFFYLRDLQTGQVFIRVGRYQDALGPLLNAKRLQHKLGWALYYDDQAQAPPPGSSHWFFTLVGLSWCFQEVDQLEEARDHSDLALRVLTPTDDWSLTLDKPHPQTDPWWPCFDRPHPLLLPLLRAVVRQSWQTGKDKRQWEGPLRRLEEQWAQLDNQPTIKEYLVKHNLQENEGEARTHTQD